MTKKDLIRKIHEEMRKVEGVETPREEDEWCGSCTGDPGYNDCYSSIKYSAGRDYDFITNSCQDFMKNCGEKILIHEMTMKQIFELYKEIKEAVKAQLEESKEVEAEIDSYFENEEK